MIRFFLLFFIMLVSLDANISLQDINSKPPSRAKNFMIWQYLKQDITPKQAQLAYTQVLGSIKIISKLYTKKNNLKIKLTPKQKCQQKQKLLTIKDKQCLEWAISSYKTTKLNNKERNLLISRIDSDSKKEFLKLQNEPHSQKSYEKYDPHLVLKLFTQTNRSYRRKKLNINLDKKFVNSLVKSSRISHFIKLVIKDDKLNKLQKSILNLNPKKLNSNTNFLLAMHCLKKAQEKKALKFFEFSAKYTKRQTGIDKNNFWMYKVSKNKKYLNKLLLSNNINIYTLYAKEISSIKVKNYFTSVEVSNKKPLMNLQDPFDWMKIRQEIKNTPKDKLLDLAKFYNQRSMIPVQTYILEKASKYNLHGFVMPYDKYLQNISIDEKALVYAIMKQESIFVPSALSRSFALGLMQIMPFVTDDLSKRMKNPIKNYNDMFTPEYNIKYALKHLKWQQKSLYHPLFMAYAYNGGMGFLKKHLLGGTFKSGKYEPFYSMETMRNIQSREYGKKVLANYVMYKRILGEDISIIHLFDKLIHPKMTDRFREQA